MVRRLCFLLSLITLAPGAAFAGVIPFTGSEAGGPIQVVQPFAYQVDNDAFDPDFPGLSLGAAIGNGSTIRSFETFDGNSLVESTGEVLGQSGVCVSEAAGGNAFCVQRYLSPSAAVRIGDNTVAFTTASGDYLPDGDPFSANSTFAGAEPTRASLSSDVPTVVPEPSTLILFGTGILGIAALLRTRKL